jgi:hypothetical protein
MRHFPNHPKDQTEFTLTEIFEERSRLNKKLVKSKADKQAIKVLDEAMQMLVTERFKGICS